MSTAHELAEKFILQLPSWDSGKLPSVRELAARHVASTATVQTALDLLRDRGLVESRPRSGWWRVGDLPKARIAAPRPTAQQLGERLCQEIRDGIHPFDSPLASFKEYSLRWNCHAQTTGRAFEVALAAGLLERHGRQHFPARPTPRRKGSSPVLLCVGAAGPDGHFEIEFDREAEFWRELGTAASLSGITLVRFPWIRWATEQKPFPITPSTLGVVASTWHILDPENLYHQLARVKIPVCVWVEDAQFHQHVRSSSRMHFHDQGYGATLGEQAASHLLDLGHKQVAYLSPWHGSLWSQNRLQGIGKEISKRGAKLQVYGLEGIDQAHYFDQAKLDPDFNLRFPQKALEEAVGGSGFRLREEAVRELGWNRIRNDTQQILEQAFEGGATAWICANDSCALMALDWLKEKGIGVPDQISVLGFDDTVGALRADLTSYRFGVAPMARSMLLQILSPTRSAALSRHLGTMIVRASTGRG